MVEKLVLMTALRLQKKRFVFGYMGAHCVAQLSIYDNLCSSKMMQSAPRG